MARDKFKVVDGGAQGDEWERDLIRDARGNVVNNLANQARILRCSPEWAGILAFNEATQDIELRDGGPCLAGSFPRAWRAGDEQLVAIWFQTHKVWRLNATPNRVLDAVVAVARERTYNPIRQHLLSLKWDGVRRLDGWLVTYTNAADTKYVRAVGTAWMRSVAARGLTPGAKCDAALILEGAQGKGKSTTFQILGGPFYVEIQSVVGDRAVQNIAGKLIAEMSELEALNRHEANATKAAITIQSDRIRLPYDRRSVDLPRTAVLCGTCNKNDYLRDETGNRRYWPVKIEGVDLVALRRDRDQLLAEAVADVQAGEPWHLVDRDVLVEATEEQEARRQVDAWEELVVTYVEGQLKYASEKRSGVTLGEVLEAGIGLKKEQWGQGEQNRVARILRAIGWERRNDLKKDDKGQPVVDERTGRPKREWRYHPIPPAPGPPRPPDVPDGGSGTRSGTHGDSGKKAAGTTCTSCTSQNRADENGGTDGVPSSVTSSSTGTTGTTGTQREKQGENERTTSEPEGSGTGTQTPASGPWTSEAAYAHLLSQGYSEADARELAGMGAARG